MTMCEKPRVGSSSADAVTASFSAGRSTFACVPDHRRTHPGRLFYAILAPSLYNPRKAKHLRALRAVTAVRACHPC